MLEKETLTAVLQFTHCTELPATLKEGDIYVRAIAKVKKANNHETMCVIVNDGEGKPIIKKDFGSVSMIKEIIEIYPLSVLESDSIPDFRKKKDVINFLVRMGETAAYVEKLAASKTDEDKAALKSLVYKHCIKLQLERENAKSIAPTSPVVPQVEPETKADDENSEDNGTETPTHSQEDTNPKTVDNGTGTDNTASEDATGEETTTGSDF